MEYFIYTMLFIVGVSFVALMLISSAGHRQKGGAELKGDRALEVLRHAA